MRERHRLIPKKDRVLEDTHAAQIIAELRDKICGFDESPANVRCEIKCTGILLLQSLAEDYFFYQ